MAVAALAIGNEKGGPGSIGRPASSRISKSIVGQSVER